MSSTKSSTTASTLSASPPSVLSSGSVTSSSAPPSPSNDANGEPNCSTSKDPVACSSPPPTTLYIYTFITTLIILLVVSGAIVTRSFFLRRRAIANGTWPPPAPRRRESQRTLRPKPLMYDVYVVAEAGEVGTEHNLRENRWGIIQPLCVSDFFSAPSTSPPPPKPIPVPQPQDLVAPPAAAESIHAAHTRLRVLLARLHQPLRHTHSHPELVRSPAVDDVPAFIDEPNSGVHELERGRGQLQGLDLEPGLHSKNVRIAVLVAMPSPLSMQQTDTGDKREMGYTFAGVVDEAKENTLPHLEFGVFEADIFPRSVVPECGSGQDGRNAEK